METEENPVKKPPCDAGWNDPPMFSYDSHSSQIKSEKRGNTLNKRIAFPLNSSEASGNSKGTFIDPTLPPQRTDLSSLPPPPSINNVSTVMNNVAPIINEEVSGSADTIEDFSEEEALLTIMKNFNDVLETKCEDEVLKEKAAEIRKRLDMIEKMWKENKFNTEIQQKLFHLARAINSGDLEKADDLQKSLMVDHASLCSPWMAGVRYILHSL